LPPDGESVIRLRFRHIPALVCPVVVALGVASAATAEPGPVASKQAEAQSIISQINTLQTQASAAVERWNLANVKLANISDDLHRSRFELGVARVNLKHAQLALERQALSVYTSGDSNSTLEVLLGSSSLDDLLNRIDTVNRVNDQRTTVVSDVKTFRSTVARETARLHHAQVEQKQVVAQRLAERQSIDSKLAESNRLLQSVRAEIVHLRAVEAARQAALARQVREQQAQQALQPAVTSLGVGTDAGGSAAAPAPAAVPAPAAPAAAPPSHYGGVVGIAMQYLGVPYVWGGASPSGFDCSGLVMYVYAQVGVSLPHSSYAQYGMGVPVSMSDLQPGDLVFFYGLGHVGIYVGGGNFIHAPHTGDVVKISSLSGSYASAFVGARRIL
jgi:peptidoglycan DL-endopeptidase CwlO